MVFIFSGSGSVIVLLIDLKIPANARRDMNRNSPDQTPVRPNVEDAVTKKTDDIIPTTSFSLQKWKHTLHNSG